MHNSHAAPSQSEENPGPELWNLNMALVFFEQLKKKQFSFFDSISHLCCSFILVVISGSRYWRHLSHTIPTAFKLDHGDLGLI